MQQKPASKTRRACGVIINGGGTNGKATQRGGADIKVGGARSKSGADLIFERKGTRTLILFQSPFSSLHHRRRPSLEPPTTRLRPWDARPAVLECRRRQRPPSTELPALVIVSTSLLPFFSNVRETGSLLLPGATDATPAATTMSAAAAATEALHPRCQLPLLREDSFPVELRAFIRCQPVAIVSRRTTSPPPSWETPAPLARTGGASTPLICEVEQRPTLLSSLFRYFDWMLGYWILRRECLVYCARLVEYEGDYGRMIMVRSYSDARGVDENEYGMGLCPSISD
ncbi:hypothetical protein DEO72_LG11g1983 [Vigna unguiculata]|uniref:Uncharacterized protein n=1 Tax=Vigna unguiculata TaxID=3917 RepID=A0A4D6NRS5_VIGUN|nr:hypothetical protein DEO72_LG11g1983 [Vigna unguiculata]